MAFDIISYSLNNGKINSVATGFDHAVRTGDNTFSVFFVDGSKVDCTIPLPKDGVSITELIQPDETHFQFKLSDNTLTDLIEIPEQIIKISSQSGNVLQKKTDGYYVEKAAVEVSKAEGNAILSKPDGLFVADVQGVEISKDSKNIAQWNEDGIYVPETNLEPYATKDELKKTNDTVALKANTSWVDEQLQQRMTIAEIESNYSTTAQSKELFGDKYSATENAEAMDKKVDKVEGKKLSTEDYSTDEKNKLEEIEEKAEVNIIESVTVNGKMMYPDRYRNLNIDLSEYQKTIEFESENLVFDEKDFGGTTYGRRI